MIKKIYNTESEIGASGAGIESPKVSIKDKIDKNKEMLLMPEVGTTSPVVFDEGDEEEIRNNLAQMRRSADSIHKTASWFFSQKGSRCLSLCITNIQEARQFLGCLLKERGSKSPYVLGNNSSTSALESHLFDPGHVYEEIVSEVADKSDEQFIIGIKKLREKCADLMTDFTVYAEKSVLRNFEESAMLPHVYVKLVASRNWLGEVLGEIATQQNAG